MDCVAANTHLRWASANSQKLVLAGKDQKWEVDSSRPVEAMQAGRMSKLESVQLAYKHLGHICRVFRCLGLEGIEAPSCEARK
jgi:hypothetical protein